jgi:hypothetical protein
VFFCFSVPKKIPVKQELPTYAIVKTLKEFKGMLWGQSIKVFTDHANLIKDALAMTLDWGYCWKSTGPRLSTLKAYTTPLQMPSHGLSMTQHQSNS